MSTINGLPAHILLVHAVVVLVPLLALMALAAAVWPAARRRMGVVLPGLGLVCLVLVPITTSAGGWLQDHVRNTALVRRHTELGDQLLPWVALLFVLTVAYWLLDHSDRVSARSQRLGTIAAHPVARPVIAVLMVAVAVVAVIEVIRIGDSGARAAWHDNFTK